MKAKSRLILFGLSFFVIAMSCAMNQDAATSDTVTLDIPGQAIRASEAPVVVINGL